MFARPLKDQSAFVGTFLGEMCVLFVFLGSSLFLIFDDKKIVENIESVCIFYIFGTVSLQMAISIMNMLKDFRMIWKKFEKSRAMEFVKNAPDESRRLDIGLGYR